MTTYLASVMVQVEVDGPDERCVADAVNDYIGDGDDSFRVLNLEVLDIEELE